MIGRITDEAKVVSTTQIACYEVDSGFRLKPSAFMDMAQEMAYLAANLMHFGYDELQGEGKAWVLSRFHFRFLDVPRWREEVRIQTWHKGPSGPFYIRDFEILDSEGRRRVEATSSWVILDVASRRMARTAEIVEMIPSSTICHDDGIAEAAPKVSLPRGVEARKVASHSVSYSDVDLLGHTNNARYVVWAMDCIDYSLVSSRAMKDLFVCFSHETRPGDVVDLYCVAQSSEDLVSYYIEGRVEDRQAFCVRIDF